MFAMDWGAGRAKRGDVRVSRGYLEKRKEALKPHQRTYGHDDKRVSRGP
jgi:hypothetical protein